MRKREKKLKVIHLLITIIILLVLIVGCVIVVRKKMSSASRTIVKNVEKQNVEVVEFSYIPEQENNIILEDESKIEEYLRNNQVQIFGKEFSKDIDFKYAYEVDVFENKSYIFYETYKDVEITNLEINVLITGNERKLISISGNYIEPEEFNTDILVSKEEAYQKFSKQVEKEIQDDEDENNMVSENADDNEILLLEECVNKIYLIDSEFIIHGYKFIKQDIEFIIDANSGGTVKIEY